MTLTPEQKPQLIGKAKRRLIHRLPTDRHLHLTATMTQRQALAAKAKFAFAEANGRRRKTADGLGE
jgi:hypothetical protein